MHLFGTTPSELVNTHCGVKQGSPDAAILFVATLGEQARHLELGWAQQGWWFVMGPTRIHSTSFADNIILMSDSPKAADNMLYSLSQRLNTFGLQVNSAKTQCMSVPRVPSALLSGKVESDNSILILGRVIRPPDSTDRDIDYKPSWAFRNSGDCVTFLGKERP